VSSHLFNPPLSVTVVSNTKRHKLGLVQRVGAEKICEDRDLPHHHSLLYWMVFINEYIIQFSIYIWCTLSTWLIYYYYALKINKCCVCYLRTCSKKLLGKVSKIGRSVHTLLAAWGRPGIHLYFTATKTPWSSALSAAGREATYHLTRSDLWGEWKTLVFPLSAALGSLLRSYFAHYSILLRILYVATYLLTLEYILTNELASQIILNQRLTVY